MPSPFVKAATVQLCLKTRAGENVGNHEQECPPHLALRMNAILQRYIGSRMMRQLMGESCRYGILRSEKEFRGWFDFCAFIAEGRLPCRIGIWIGWRNALNAAASLILSRIIS
jgi:hypothetical protein